jgi:hypothetical protein
MKNRLFIEKDSVKDKGGIGNPAPQIQWQSRLPQEYFALKCRPAVAENQPDKAKPHDN